MATKTKKYRVTRVVERAHVYEVWAEDEDAAEERVENDEGLEEECNVVSYVRYEFEELPVKDDES